MNQKPIMSIMYRQTCEMAIIIYLISMDNFAKFNRSVTIKNEDGKLPQLSERNLDYYNPDLAKKQNTDLRLQQLQGSIRLLEKKYKQNLKEGFENKIKSFRLQAVMERKVIKATIQQTKREIESEEKKQKMIRANQERAEQAMRHVSITERKKQKLKRVRKTFSRQKKQLMEKIKQQQQQAQNQNRELHHRLIEQNRVKGRKKMYFDTIRKSQYSQEMEREKKHCISRILENNQLLQKLQNELTELANSQRSKKLDNVLPQHTFVTI